LPHEQVGNLYQNISQTFQHFFARKVMFVKFASAYVVMPGGFGTLDELMEALTLVDRQDAQCRSSWSAAVLGRYDRMVSHHLAGRKSISPEA
jgi:predicted Rossmann-fold nucleotide-binding protein